MNAENNPKAWIRIAEMDLSSAHFLFENHHPKPLDIVCFHTQQSAEKMLKCFLVVQNEGFPKIHDLQELCELCAEINDRFNELRSSIVILNRYSVIPRYPNELQIEESDAIKALEHADIVMDFVKGILTAEETDTDTGMDTEINIDTQ